MVALVTMVMVAAELIVAAMACQNPTNGNGVQWQQLQWQCLNEINSVTRADEISKIECMAIASSSVDDVVAQWSSHTGVCLVFAYQQVCGMATAAVSTACAVYRRVFTNTISLVQCYSKKFVAVYEFGADANTHNRLDSCASNKNRFHPKSISWSAEGAVFNGAGSYMLLNDSESMSFSSGLTWLVRLKRQLIMQCFIRAVPCHATSMRGHLCVHNDDPNVLLYNPSHKMPDSIGIVSKTAVLLNDSNAWINVGVTVSKGNATVELFVDDGFLPNAAVYRWSTNSAPLEKYCIMMGGWGVVALHGTVRAVGIANTSMTEAEIRHFFQQLQP